MRYAIWTAVSSKPQAEKVSLNEQERKCRSLANSKGWQEVSVSPFIVPGESRTRWVNLRDAENEISALKDMLDSAQRGMFDVLVLYDFTRLRELLDPVSRTLAAYGVQLYSLGQPVEPVPPDQYDAYATDASSIVQTVSGLTSRTEINALRRRYRIGLPRRVADKGLHPLGRPPYGYRKMPGRELDKSIPVVLDPVESLVVTKIKDLYLQGQSVPQIIDYLEDKGIRTRSGKKRWSDFAVRFILKNPFYAGIVSFGRTTVTTDPRTGIKTQKRQNDQSKIVTAEGQHQSLWDMATHQALLDEHKRRHKRYKGKNTYRLSLLLYCKEHDRPLYVGYIRGCRDDDHRVWFCPEVFGNWHLFTYDHQALADLAEKLVSDFQNLDNLELPNVAEKTNGLEQALNDLQQRKERLLDALEQGVLDALSYGGRIEPLNKQVADIQEKLLRIEQAQENQKHRNEALSAVAQALQKTPDYLTRAPAQEVNTNLRMLINRISLSEDGMEIDYN